MSKITTIEEYMESVEDKRLLEEAVYIVCHNRKLEALPKSIIRCMANYLRLIELDMITYDKLDEQRNKKVLEVMSFISIYL